MQIFSANTSLSEPPKTVKSCEKTKTLRPKIGPVAGDDRVAVRAPVHHPEVRLAVADVAVELDERARVAELLRALAREQAAFVAPLLHRALAAGVQRLVAQLAQPLELRLRRLVRIGHAPEPNLPDA